jgi:hypothetical protein
MDEVLSGQNQHSELTLRPQQTTASLLDVAINVVRGGLAVFFLSEKKTPLKGSHGFYDATKIETELVSLYHRYRGAAYIAYATGSANGVALLDLDFEHPEAVAWYEANKNRLPATFTYKTRSGGLHLVFQDHPKLKTCAGNIETGVDVKAKGGYACAWFLHGYEIVRDIYPAPWPDWLDIPNTKASTRRKRVAEAAERARPTAVMWPTESPPNQNISVDVKGGLNTRMERPIGIEEGARDDTLFRWACSGFARGLTFDEVLAECRACNATFAPPLDEATVLAKVESASKYITESLSPEQKAEIKRLVNLKNVSPILYGKEREAVAEKLGTTVTFLDLEVQRARSAADTDTVSNTANAQATLSTNFPGAFAFDEMAHETLINIGKWERLTDNHVIEIQIYLQKNGLEYISKESTHDAIEACARRNSFHPIRKYLESLTWDGVERLPTWLNRYLGVNQNEYTKAVGTMFMISAIARIMDPGCQADYTLVFEGPQGQLKSSVCRTLAGDAHFLDHLPPLKNKDSSQILRGKWIIECPEMRAFSDAKISETKEFITRRIEIYFARYGRVESKEPRQCVIIISINPSIYLYDTTGNRRYWPVKIGTIDLEALKRDRDQLWAEAKARYDKGEHWWPNREFERKYILPEQEARYQEDPWTEAITTWLDNPRMSILDGGSGNKTRPPLDRITIGELAGGALHLETKDNRRRARWLWLWSQPQLLAFDLRSARPSQGDENSGDPI